MIHKVSPLRFVPAACGILLFVTCVGTYIAAALQLHVQGALPYVSDAASAAPESCVFGQLINIGTILVACLMYIRYMQTKELIAQHPELVPKIQFLNNALLWMIAPICTGMSMIANFQRSHSFYPHRVGGVTFFGVSALSMCAQTKITYDMRPFTGSLRMAIFRGFLAVLSTASIAILTITSFYAVEGFKGEDSGIWFEEDGAYIYHVVSTSFEWVTITSLCIFMSSYYGEFRNVVFVRPRIIIY